MSSTTSNITFYDSSTATIQALQFRSRGFSLAPTLANQDFVINFMKGAHIEYSNDGTVDWTSSTFEIPDMTFDRPVIDDYGRHFIYNGIYKATIQNNGVIQAQQMYDAYDHRIGIDFIQANSNIISSNIYGSNIETIQINSSNIFNSTNMVSSNMETSNMTAYNNLNVIGNIYGNGQYLTNLPSVSSQWTTNGNSIFYNTGNVGVGTNTPSKKLEVIGNIKCTQIEADGSLLTNLPVTSSQWTTSGLNIFYSTGNVGVGTIVPSQKLEVNGTVKATAFTGDGSAITNLPVTSSQWTTTNINDIYYNTGAVGLGITVPTARLDVLGAINASSTITASSFIGQGVVPTGCINYFMGRIAPSGYLTCDGLPFSRSTYANLFNVLTPYSSSITLTLSNPCVITWTAHPLAVNDIIVFQTTGTLPSSITAFTKYYVTLVVSVNTFRISATEGGTAISTNGQSQSGSHTCFNAPFGLPNATNFNVPNLKGLFIRCWDYDNTVDQTERAWGSYQEDAIQEHSHGMPNALNGTTADGGTVGNVANDTFATRDTNNTGGVETRPKNIALLTCIKY